MTDTPHPWLPVQFAGYDSTGSPLFSINGGRTQHDFSLEDMKEAFLGLLPEPPPVEGYSA